MPAKLLEGTPLAEAIAKEAAKDIEALKAKGITPLLVAVQVGENKESAMYIKSQRKSCEDVGLAYRLDELPADTTPETFKAHMDGLAGDPAVSAIILQMPLPEHLDSRECQMQIAPDKDAEGMTPANMGRLVSATNRIGPCTAVSAVELLKSAGEDLKGKEVVVIGHSEIVGKPIALLLLQSLTEAPTVTVCHIATRDLAFHTKRADVVISAVGVPNLIKGDMLKEGSIAIVVGSKRVKMLDENGDPVISEKTGRPRSQAVGDVDFDAAMEKCSAVTPLKGGVGILTAAILVRNAVACAKAQAGL